MFFRSFFVFVLTPGFLVPATLAQNSTPDTASQAIASQDTAPSYKIKVRADKDTAIYEKGEQVSFQVQLLANDKPLAGKNLWYTLQGDGRYESKGTLLSDEGPVLVQTSLEYPGFLKCTVGWNEGPDGKKFSAMGGAAVAPLEIRAQTSEPEDFDVFWNAKKAALAAMPMNSRLEPVEQNKNDKVLVFDVQVDCLGGRSLSGYLAKPKDAREKSLPIIVSYHGAGVRSANMPIGDAASGCLALDVNAHGIENGKPEEFYQELSKNELKDYRLAGAQDRETIYFTGMYLRVIRSLQFMKSLPEWDGKTIVVKGTSQGGGQALVAAGIDPDVSFCAAFVPALCYPTGDVEGHFGGWPGFLRGKTLETADPAIVQAVQYIDAANFAKRIKAESFLSTGFIDYVCSPTSVYVAYNNITAPKQIIPTPETGHGVPPKTYQMSGKLIRDFIERQRVTKEDTEKAE